MTRGLQTPLAYPDDTLTGGFDKTPVTRPVRRVPPARPALRVPRVPLVQLVPRVQLGF